MKSVKRIDPMSAGKVSAALGVIMGLIFAVLLGISSSFTGMVDMMNPYGTMSPSTGNAGLAALIMLPITYAIVGFISGFVWSAIYNFVAGKIGGVKIDLK